MLIPWVRNHGYLRDFYDYGLVMAGVARMDAGQSPYVDFVTPIQTGLFLFNGWAEKLGDGTYQAMTHGAAGLTVLSTLLLAALLARRWSGGIAVLVAGALTAMTAAQHTIIWHNTVGVFCIALATWSAAIAPLWRRPQWGWHVVTAAALVIGGINKLNSHLVAVCGVLAWVLLAGFLRKGSWLRVVATMAGVAVCAFVLPLAIELGVTGASFSEWWYSVVATPFGGRTGDLMEVFTWKFYFATQHNYYGALPVPQLGALGVAVTALWAVIAARQKGWRHAGWVLAAAMFAGAAGLGLLATNYEIAYVAMGAWFALLVSLWLGFELPAGGTFFHGTLVIPLVLMGVLAWQSAWIGQRSQFGYSVAARTDYVDGASVAGNFSYLRGTRVPPEVGQSLEAGAFWHRSLSAEQTQQTFYGPGAEWLERPWPTLKLRGIPLWAHGGTSYGVREEAQLAAALGREGPYQNVLVPVARDDWSAAVSELLQTDYTRRRVGPMWSLYEKRLTGIVSRRPLAFLAGVGGNVNASQLESEMTLHALADGRKFIGVTRGSGEMRLVTPSYRAQGSAVLRLLPGHTFPADLKVSFEVFSVSDGKSYRRWSTEITLADGQVETLVPFPVDCGGSPLRFVVTIPPELADRVAAGWRELRLLHTVDGPAKPLSLSNVVDPAEPASEAMRAALLPADWPALPVFVHRAYLGAHGVELPPGGEIWVRLEGMWSDISGVISVAADQPMSTEHTARVLFFKGARLDGVDQAMMKNSARTFNFRAWSPESDGWLVFSADIVGDASPVTVKITGAKRAN